MLPDLKEWRGSGDLDAIEDQWAASAMKLLAAQDHALDSADHTGFAALSLELNDAAIRVSELSAKAR